MKKSDGIMIAFLFVRGQGDFASPDSNDGLDSTVAASEVLEVSHHLHSSSDFHEISFDDDDIGDTDHLVYSLWKPINPPVPSALIP